MGLALSPEQQAALSLAQGRAGGEQEVAGAHVPTPDIPSLTPIKYPNGSDTSQWPDILPDFDNTRRYGADWWGEVKEGWDQAGFAGAGGRAIRGAPGAYYSVLKDTTLNSNHPLLNFGKYLFGGGYDNPEEVGIAAVSKTGETTPGNLNEIDVASISAKRKPDSLGKINQSTKTATVDNSESRIGNVEESGIAANPDMSGNDIIAKLMAMETEPKTMDVKDMLARQRKSAYGNALVQLGAGIADDNLSQGLSRAGIAAMQGQNQANETELLAMKQNMDSQRASRRDQIYALASAGQIKTAAESAAKQLIKEKNANFRAAFNAAREIATAPYQNDLTTINMTPEQREQMNIQISKDMEEALRNMFGMFTAVGLTGFENMQPGEGTDHAGLSLEERLKGYLRSGAQ
jgi:hypothetical protein